MTDFHTEHDAEFLRTKSRSKHLDTSSILSSLFIVINVVGGIISGTNAMTASSSGLTFELSDNDKMCFFEDNEGNDSYVFEFRVINGGNYDVDVLLEAPSGIFVFNEQRREQGALKLDYTEEGTYKICFSNEFSTITHKTIYFHFRPIAVEQLMIERDNVPGAQTLLESSTESIHSTLTEVVHYQTQYRLNEAKGRHAADSLNSNVQLWSIVQSFIVLVTGFGQVFVLRRFFSDRRDPPLISVTTGDITVRIGSPPIKGV